MRAATLLVFSFSLVLVLAACEKKYFKPPVIDPNAAVSFSKDVQPVFTANCTGSGCHNGSQKPNLIDGKAYGSLVDEAYVDTLNPATSVLMVKLNTNMPQSGKLPAATIVKIQNWIKQGAKDN